ncbi:hypothetical protein POUND7_006598 [Theobroma cacao]
MEPFVGGGAMANVTKPNTFRPRGVTSLNSFQPGCFWSTKHWPCMLTKVT